MHYNNHAKLFQCVFTPRLVKVNIAFFLVILSRVNPRSLPDPIWYMLKRWSLRYGSIRHLQSHLAHFSYIIQFQWFYYINVTCYGVFLTTRFASDMSLYVTPISYLICILRHEKSKGDWTMSKIINWVKTKLTKPKWDDLHIPILQKPMHPTMPVFHGNSHQRRVARRSWERDQARKYLEQTRDAGSEVIE